MIRFTDLRLLSRFTDTVSVLARLSAVCITIISIRGSTSVSVKTIGKPVAEVQVATAR
jgi:hypothetical protein